MEINNDLNEAMAIEHKNEPGNNNTSLLSSLRTWTLIVSFMGSIAAASFAWFRISLNTSPGKWTIEGHRDFAWTDIAEGILMVLFMVSLISLFLFSLQMGRLVKKRTNIDESGLLTRSSLLRLRNHFKFLGITFMLIFVAVLYGVLSSTT